MGSLLGQIPDVNLILVHVLVMIIIRVRRIEPHKYNKRKLIKENTKLVDIVNSSRVKMPAGCMSDVAPDDSGYVYIMLNAFGLCGSFTF